MVRHTIILKASSSSLYGRVACGRLRHNPLFHSQGALPKQIHLGICYLRVHPLQYRDLAGGGACQVRAEYVDRRTELPWWARWILPEKGERGCQHHRNLRLHDWELFVCPGIGNGLQAISHFAAELTVLPWQMHRLFVIWGSNYYVLVVPVLMLLGSTCKSQDGIVEKGVTKLTA